MLAGIGARVLGVLGIQLQPFLRRFRADRAIKLGEVVLHRERAGLSGFVLDGGDDRPLRVEQGGRSGH